MVDKDKVKALRDQGITYEEIGERCGCTCMYAWYVVNGREKSFREITEEDCAYANIRRWMNEHKVSVGDMSVALYGRRDSGYPQQTRRMLGGARTMYKDLIDKLLAFTGMSYEEAFANG